MSSSVVPRSGVAVVIADRRYLAEQFRELQLELSLLSDWIDRPDRQFPGDAVALADRFRRLTEMLMADAVPGGQAE